MTYFYSRPSVKLLISNSCKEMIFFANRQSDNIVLFLALLLILVSCSSEVDKPEKDSEAYRNIVSDFYTSLAAIQADQLLFAVEKMEAISDQYPDEAAAWANLAVFAMRQANFDLAVQRINKALNRAPENADINFLAGIIESRRGDVNQSVDYLREAAELDPANPKIVFALVEELERQGEQENSGEVFSLLDSILEQQPDNLAVLLEIVRISVKRNNQENLERAMSGLTESAEKWPPDIQRQFNEIKNTILKDSSTNLTFQLAFLGNSLNQLPEFQSDLSAVQIPPSQVGFLVTEFTWLPQPTTSAAPKDDELSFNYASLTGQTDLQLVKPVSLADREISDWLIVKNESAWLNGNFELPFPGLPASKNAVATIDYNYDFFNDLVFAGSEGFKMFEQQKDSTYVEITNSLNLSENLINQPYRGSWARDIDLDGDLDLVMSVEEGSVVVLRNNGDGTFDSSGVFEDINEAVDFVWADFDGDSDADAVFLTSNGEVHLLRNERSSEFSKVESLPDISGIIDIDIADIDSDGNFELLVWHQKGISRMNLSSETGNWDQEQLVAADDLFTVEDIKPGEGGLFTADMDNNGSIDLLATTSGESMLWLSDENLNFVDEAKELDGGVVGVADFDGDTRLDMVSLDQEGHALLATNSGSKDYMARVIRPRASGTLGDQRINSFGIGGEIEIRSGLLYQKQLIKEPWVHLGLGTYDEAEVLRIIWPNGSSQAEFAELGYDTRIFNEQILKGSCPWVFTYNGNEMEFVTDFLWRTGLGIRINAQGSADVIHSIDWIKIAGSQLKSRNGHYDIRITADLWETHFFDHVSLMAVDHPSDTEVFVDERFTFPPRKPKLHVFKELKPVARARDQDGKDVTGKIRHKDREFVDSFKLTEYQGIAEEHYIEVDLGQDIPEKENLRLVASGWIYPTDTSINIAISQGNRKGPYPIRLEVPDGEGGWKVAKEKIGFPAGKSKTMLIDLTGIFEQGTERKVRLVTNMEIYWNQILLGIEQPDKNLQREELKFSEVELRYRGFSAVERPGRFEPELPNYQQISGTTPMWSDLEGFYTRFGSVNELLEKTDDRYVIMNAGDELVFRFPTLSEPKEGWQRDFVLIGDGWVKDGDYNTGFSTTVLPLPYHGMEDYSEAPGGLENDPVFKKHREDWVHYHTRYVTPKPFRSALKFDKQ